VTSLAGVSFFAYGTPKWGVNVAAGDLDGDGYDEIVTGAGPGAIYGPHVRGWNVDGGAAAAMGGVSFLAYGTNKFGVNVACGDIDGDGIDEIVTGAGPGAVFGSHVRGWNVDGGTATALANLNLFAWPSSEIRYGAEVFAGADLDGDGRDEIVVGQGPDPEAGTWVKVYQFDGSQAVEWFSLETFGDLGLTRGANAVAGHF
jgi:fibronectin-binding autotransporter adhesin